MRASAKKGRYEGRQGWVYREDLKLEENLIQLVKQYRIATSGRETDYDNCQHYPEIDEINLTINGTEKRMDCPEQPSCDFPLFCG